MSSFNPYQAPSASLDGSGQLSTGLVITESMITALTQTRPWVIFLAVLGFIGAGLLVIGALFMLIVAVAGSNFGSSSSNFSGGLGAGVAIVYLLFAGIYVLPSLLLIRYGAAIGRIRIEGGRAFEEALRHQKAFWQTFGIMVVVIMVLYFLVIVVALLAAIVGGSLASLGHIPR